MADSSLRLLLLLREIPREPLYIGSSTLRDRLADAGHEVSLRTVQRDMQALSTHFPLVQNKPEGRGKSGLGWAFSEISQNISFPVMGSAAALTLMLARQHLQHLLPTEVLKHLEPFVQEAQSLLGNHNNGQYRDWYDKVRIAPQNILLPPEVNADTLTQIYQALLQSRQFSATYNGQPERIIHPYGLVQQGSVLYLICRFYEYEDVRITALQRYSEVSVLEDSVREFPSFKIDDYLGQGVMHWSPGGQIELKIKVKSWLANHLDESPLSYQQQLQKCHEGKYLVIADALDSLQLRRWLLSYCAELEVLEPIEIRDWMTEQLKRAIKTHTN